MSDTVLTNHPLSEDVKIFPYGTSRESDLYTRVLNEYNITNMIKSIVDKDSFVITDTIEWSESRDESNNVVEKTDIEFVIGGYYFKLTLNKGELTKGNDLFASIMLYTPPTDPDNPDKHITNTHISGSDNSVNKTFDGLTLSAEGLTDDGYISLQLLDADWNIPVSSKIKFDLSSFPTLEIDKAVNRIFDIQEDNINGIDVICCGDANSVIDDPYTEESN